MRLFSIPLLVCFPCSSSADVSGGVVGWIHVPNPAGISTTWKWDPWSCACASRRERPARPSGSDRDRDQLSCSWKCSPRLHFAAPSLCLWFGVLVVCCFVLDFFGMKAVHYSLFPDVPDILSLFLPLFPSINVFIFWKSFLLGAGQTGTCEGSEIKNWGIFRMLSVVIFTHNSMRIIATTDVLV